MAQITDAERNLLSRLAASPMLVSSDARLSRRFVLEDLRRRGLVKSAQHQVGGIIYSVTQAGLDAIAYD